MEKKYAALFLGSAILSLSTFLVFSMIACSSSTANAASAREDYNKIQRDIRNQKKKLAEATKTEQSVISELRRIESQLSDLNDQMNATKSPPVTSE